MTLNCLHSQGICAFAPGDEDDGEDAMICGLAVLLIGGTN